MKNAAHREMSGVFLCLMEGGCLFRPHRFREQAQFPSQKKPLCPGRHSGFYRLNPCYIVSL
jgi:hypothetical protein